MITVKVKDVKNANPCNYTMEFLKRFKDEDDISMLDILDHFHPSGILWSFKLIEGYEEKLKRFALKIDNSVPEKERGYQMIESAYNSRYTSCRSNKEKRDFVIYFKELVRDNFGR